MESFISAGIDLHIYEVQIKMVTTDILNSFGYFSINVCVYELDN